MGLAAVITLGDSDPASFSLSKEHVLNVTFQHEDLFKEDFFAFAKMSMVSELIQVISGWEFNSSLSPSND